MATETKTDGGPAFPDPLRGAEPNIMNQDPWERPMGMTLRDYFAAKAMHGRIAIGTMHTEGIAEWAYEQADSMLKARESR